MIVSPDIGGGSRPRRAKSLGVDLAIIDKRREKANVSEVMHIIGDVEGRTCVRWSTTWSTPLAPLPCRQH